MLARDVYSILHYPMVLGIIAFAATVDHVLSHPTEPLGIGLRALLASSVLLFVGGMAIALWRAGSPVSSARRWLPLVTAVVVFTLSAVPAVMSLVVVLVGLTLLAFAEPVRKRHHLKAKNASAPA